MNLNNIKFHDKFDNFVILRNEGSIVYIDDCKICPKNIKMFAILLKSSFKSMKEKGCIIHRQYVIKNDWNNCLQNCGEWKIISNNTDTDTNNDYLLIECDIDSAAYAVMYGLIN